MSRAMMDAWESFGDSVADMTENEYHWRPSPDALTFADLLPPESEDWRGYYAKMPTPPPLATIEHKIAHGAVCKIMYAEYGFRAGRLQWRWDDLRVPAILAAMHPSREAAPRGLRGWLDGLADADLPAQRKTNWGDLWPIERILWTMITHDIGHGAQIRTLRALYRATHAWPA